MQIYEDKKMQSSFLGKELGVGEEDWGKMENDC